MAPQDPQGLMQRNWNVVEEPDHGKFLKDPSEGIDTPKIQKATAYAINPNEGTVMVDTTGNGVVDSILADTTGSGELDTVIELPTNGRTFSTAMFSHKASKQFQKCSATSIRLSAAHAMAQEVMRSSDVVMICPTAGKVDAKKADQAAAYLNTKQAFRERHSLRDHPAIDAVLREWWTVGMGRGYCDEMCMTKALYMEQGVAIMKSLCPSESHKDVTQAVEEDWIVDSGGDRSLRSCPPLLCSCPPLHCSIMRPLLCSCLRSSVTSTLFSSVSLDAHMLGCFLGCMHSSFCIRS